MKRTGNGKVSVRSALFLVTVAENPDIPICLTESTQQNGPANIASPLPNTVRRCLAPISILPAVTPAITGRDRDGRG